jgi:hypothetical protein
MEKSAAGGVNPCKISPIFTIGVDCEPPWAEILIEVIPDGDANPKKETCEALKVTVVESPEPDTPVTVTGSTEASFIPAARVEGTKSNRTLFSTR